MTKKKKIILWGSVSLIILVIIAGTVSFSSSWVRAQILPILPFGGRVLVMYPCTCPSDIGKFIVTVGPPKPIVAVYDFRFAWLTLKMFYNFSIGQKVLGYATVTPPGTCWELVIPPPPAPPFCVPVFVGPYIFVVGTTLIPPP